MSVNPGYFSSFFVIFAVIFYFSIVSMNKARTAISIFFIFSFLYPSSSFCILLSGPIYYPSFPSSSVLNGTISIVSVFFALLLCLLFSSAMCVSVLKIKCQENNV